MSEYNFPDEALIGHATGNPDLDSTTLGSHAPAGQRGRIRFSNWLGNLLCAEAQDRTGDTWFFR